MKKYRKDEIIKLSRGKRVLHLGFIQHSNLWRTKIKENDWLHSKIMASASYAVGIDYLVDEVEIIKKELGLVAYFEMLPTFMRLIYKRLLMLLYVVNLLSI